MYFSSIAHIFLVALMVDSIVRLRRSFVQERSIRGSYYQWSFISLLIQYRFSIKAQAMNSDFKSYTFKSQSSYNHNHFNHHQSYNSPTFKTSQRAQSLTLKQNLKSMTQTQSFHQYFGNNRKRKHRIFDDLKPAFHQQSLSTSKKNRKSIFAKQDKAQPQVETQKLSFQNLKVKQGQKIIYQSIKSPFQCKDLIEKKLAERINGIGLMAEMQIKEKMAIKQRQIRYLKMQIERYKRCQTINKQNEDLHKSIQKKLKQRVIQSDTSSMKKERSQFYTPIHSLKQIKFTLGPSESPVKKNEEKQKPVQAHKTTPLKTIPENEENHFNTQSNTQPLSKQIVVQLKTTSKSKQKAQKQSPIKLVSPKRQKDPIYMQIKQKLNENHNVFKKDINQIPLNYRLYEMNRALQSSFNAQVSRPLSRPHSQSSQKTRRVEQSLKKSHYYIMMQ